MPLEDKARIIRGTVQLITERVGSIAQAVDATWEYRTPVLDKAANHVVCSLDGAKDNWSDRERHMNRQLLDFFHVTEYLARACTEQSSDRFGGYRSDL